MNNNLVQFRLDNIVGNVDDLEEVLCKFQKLSNLKPFIKFELDLQPIYPQLWKMIPMMMIKSIISKLKSQYIRFKKTEVQLN
ncbi:MAG: hypothetical protein ACFFC3_07275 [Candidatus Odinarchaeota archaeon]